MARSKRPNRPPSNPFIHARALAPHEDIERGTAVEELAARAAGGHNVTLYAPRRFGKTSLLKHVLAEIGRRGMPGVLIDLSDVLSVADVAARLQQAFRALPGKL